MPEPAATFPVEAQIASDGQGKCEDVLTRWMAALNRYDASAMDALMHFPHVRIAGGVVTVYQPPGNNPMDLFERLRKQDGWHHSAWNETKLVQSSPAKAHYAVRYTRYREDRSVIGVYDSLYVLSLLGGA
ncbi:hypothetical protein H8B02_09615 [Bradyrhizobium sp. Pear77]|uniref:hypothetical protein n=1 Tax=Bradyrhizobium altum TaxID=1571202 RepID=UPI001E2B415E|nr:hypothetical protein [Bradyrhizobium altum]MCC8953699.1 hypothetical protein [Bradyrhizobium altum]